MECRPLGMKLNGLHQECLLALVCHLDCGSLGRISSVNILFRELLGGDDGSQPWRAVALRLPSLSELPPHLAFEAGACGAANRPGAWRDVCRLANRMHGLPTGLVLPDTPSLACEWRCPNPADGEKSLSKSMLERSLLGHCPVVTFSGEIGGDRAMRSATPWTFLPCEKPDAPPSILELYKRSVRKKVTSERPQLSRPKVLALIRKRFEGKVPGGPTRAKERELSKRARELRIEYDERVAALRRGAWRNSSLLQPVVTSQGLLSLVPVRYFEITLQEPSGGQAEGCEQEMCVALGFCSKKFKLTGRQPGWDGRSVACHSDDGMAYFNHEKHRLELKFKAGDTVGVGLRLDDGDPAIFFTLNSKFHSWLGRLEYLVFSRQMEEVLPAGEREVHLFPVVGLDSHCPVEINLGNQPFVFDLVGSKKLWKPLKGPVSGDADGLWIEVMDEDEEGVAEGGNSSTSDDDEEEEDVLEEDQGEIEFMDTSEGSSGDDGADIVNFMTHFGQHSMDHDGDEEDSDGDEEDSDGDEEDSDGDEEDSDEDDDEDDDGAEDDDDVGEGNQGGLGIY